MWKSQIQMRKREHIKIVNWIVLQKCLQKGFCFWHKRLLTSCKWRGTDGGDDARITALYPVFPRTGEFVRPENTNLPTLLWISHRLCCYQFAGTKLTFIIIEGTNTIFIGLQFKLILGILKYLKKNWKTNWNFFQDSEGFSQILWIWQFICQRTIWVRKLNLGIEVYFNNINFRAKFQLSIYNHSIGPYIMIRFWTWSKGISVWT